MKTLKLVELSDLREAKDGRNYYVAGFSSGFGQKVGKRTFWEQFKKDENGDNTEEKYWERGSYKEAQALLKSGETVEGMKVTHNVESYSIGEGENEREVNTYSTIVFPDEKIENVFNSAGHPIVDEETGEILAKKAVLAPTPKVSEEVEG